MVETQAMVDELKEEANYLRGFVDNTTVRHSTNPAESIVLLHMHRNQVLDGATNLTNYDEWLQMEYESAINELPT